MAKKSYGTRDYGHADEAQNVAHPVPEMPYLLKRGNTYSFSRRAPFPLKPGFVLDLGGRTATVGKNGFIRFPLRTTDKKAAAAGARRFAHLVDLSAERIVAVLDSRIVPCPTIADPPTTAEIAHAAAVMRADLLNVDEEQALVAVASILAKNDVSREPDRYLWSMEDLPPASSAGQAVLLERLGRLACWYIFKTSEKTIETIGPELLPFANSFRQLIGDLSARASGVELPTPSVPVKPSTLRSWSQTLNYYFEQRQTVPKTQQIYATAWGALEKHAKCAPAELHPDQIVSFRDKVLRPELARTTAKNRLSICAAIWRENCEAGHIPRGTLDPFGRLTVRVPTGEATSRVLFTDDELTKIFSAAPPTTLSSVSEHAGYWLPLLAAYYGARLEELTGLEVADLVDSPAGISFWIRPNTTRNIKGKARASRCLPLHPVLKRLGFEKYCRAAQSSGVKMLFPSLSSSRSFGEEFVAHCKKLLNPVVGRKVGLHCFRHNWETAKRNATPNISDSAARYMLGRVIDAGSAGGYGAAAGQPKLLVELSRIGYGIKHRKAPIVTVSMLRNQERKCIESCKAGQQRAETRRKRKALVED